MLLIFKKFNLIIKTKIYNIIINRCLTTTYKFNTNMKQIGALLLFLISCFTLFAQDFTYSGLQYSILNEIEKTCKVVRQDPVEIAGNIIIPDEVEFNGEKYMVTTIGERAFYMCKYMHSIEIPNSITSIEREAFYHCRITSIYIPDTITSLSDWVFGHCGFLEEVRLPENLISIGENSFDSCFQLKTIEIPNSVVSIGKEAFWFCIGLKSITLPPSITIIREGTFDSCESLTSVVIPNSVTAIQKKAFFCCQELPSIEIPNSVTLIEEDAFAGCPELTSFNIPESVISINPRSFRSCKNLLAFNVASDNPVYCSVDGIIYSKDKTKLIILPSGFAGKLTIPENVTSIGEYAFYNNETLTSVEFPSSIISIESYCLQYCSNLKTIICYSEVPPVITDKTFAYIGTKFQIYVPTKSLFDYANADYWKNFDIKSIDEYTSGVDAAICDNKEILYYDLQGNRIVKPKKGIFIRISNGKSSKIIIPNHDD